jgi:hypothetical protein
MKRKPASRLPHSPTPTFARIDLPHHNHTISSLLPLLILLLLLIIYVTDRRAYLSILVRACEEIVWR